ncbi:MAG: hypothetical protein KDI39_07670 [Pseudomonadales bacterium]|nr:hypothetical protein [Pseudomonadales bacterium]
MNNVTIYKSSHPVVLVCWSRDIQEATRRLLAAKRPNGLPSSVSEQVLYFKHLYGAVAVMTATDYMAKHLRLKNTRTGVVHQYSSIEALLAADWVLR